MLPMAMRADNVRGYEKVPQIGIEPNDTFFRREVLYPLSY